MAVDKGLIVLFAYIGRRLGAVLVILLGSSFLVYNLEAIAGDPLEDLRNSTAKNKAFLMGQLIHQLQLNVPPPARYFIWLRGVMGIFTGHPDLGRTRSNQSVVDAVAGAVPITIRLVLLATVLAILLGIAIGVVTAIRQYSRFDYAMTFVSFLLFSLPVFWVAVLLKQFLAIQFNTFLSDPTITWPWILFPSAAIGVVFAGAISGDRKRVFTIFGIAAASTAAIEIILNLTNWLTHPGFGPIVIAGLGAGIAFLVTQVSTGLENRAALKSSMSMAVLGLALYYPIQWVFDNMMSGWTLLGLVALTILMAYCSAMFFAKVDRGASARTAIITAIFIALLTFIDRLMQAFPNYFSSDSINYRPVPTIGINNQLLSPEELSNFWTGTLDTMFHMVLPTIALTLISFAGYVRYSRGSLLEVMNMDYIRTARAKGLTERTVIIRHALRNAMIPLTTLMAFDFAAVIGGAIITEQVFGWKGMGSLFNEAINGQDLNLLMGVFLLTSFMAVMANLIADLLYTALDPRIRVR